ncbi:MAG: peptide deformylase [Lachnospiraceae bacterium]|nr:peptide deformylase [Lachnospiraceae bacterium]
MAIRNIRMDDDEILRKKSKVVKEITPRTEELIDDMIDSVHEYNGVGLAAVQVGVLKRICIVTVEAPEPVENEDGELEEVNPLIHNNGEDLIIINPEIIPQEDCDVTDNEGCLSVPGKFGLVTRPFHITLKAFDRNLEPFELEAEGLLARAICHECDHMDGILYTDKVEGELHDVSELMPEEEEEEIDEEAIPEEEATEE